MTVFTRTKEKPGFPGSETLLVSGSLLPLVHTSVLTHLDSKSPSCDSLNGNTFTAFPARVTVSALRWPEGPLSHLQSQLFARGRPSYYPGVSSGCQGDTGAEEGSGNLHLGRSSHPQGEALPCYTHCVPGTALSLSTHWLIYSSALHF